MFIRLHAHHSNNQKQVIKLYRASNHQQLGSVCVINLRSKRSALCNFHLIEDLNTCHQIACSRRSDRRDGAKRREQKKTARGWVRGSYVFSRSLTSRGTPLSERLEQASHQIISDRRSKRTPSDCVLFIPIILTGIPSECVLAT